jgi:hypothetical protein
MYTSFSVNSFFDIQANLTGIGEVLRFLADISVCETETQWVLVLLPRYGISGQAQMKR